MNTITDNAKLIPNLIVLLAKKYIYRSRCEDKCPLYQNFLNHLKNFESIEKFVAIQNNKKELHQQKWSQFHIKL